MPFVSDRAIVQMKSKVSALQKRASGAATRARATAREKAEELKTVGESVVAAGAMGFLRGKFQESDGSFELMGVDIELAAGVALILPQLLSLKVGLPNEDLRNAGVGVLSHYVGQISRKYARTGNFTMVAGDDDDDDLIVGGLYQQRSGQSQFSLPRVRRDDDDMATVSGTERLAEAVDNLDE